jgi:hypothetical protein
MLGVLVVEQFVAYRDDTTVVGECFSADVDLAGGRGVGRWKYMPGDVGGTDAPTVGSLTVSAMLATLSSDMGEFARGDNERFASSGIEKFHAEMLRPLDDA